MPVLNTAGGVPSKQTTNTQPGKPKQPRKPSSPAKRPRKTLSSPKKKRPISLHLRARSSSPKKKAPTRGLDLSQLDAPSRPAGPATALSASGIDNALDALTLTSGQDPKIDKHPERRFKAAYAAFEERRLKEMDEDGSGQGLRQNQKKEKLRKEFERSPENPFNQVSVAYDATKEEIAELKKQEKAKIEVRLGR